MTAIALRTAPTIVRHRNGRTACSVLFTGRRCLAAAADRTPRKQVTVVNRARSAVSGYPASERRRRLSLFHFYFNNIGPAVCYAPTEHVWGPYYNINMMTFDVFFLLRIRQTVYAKRKKNVDSILSKLLLLLLLLSSNTFYTNTNVFI